jgi:FkbM family methyltransferase
MESAIAFTHALRALGHDLANRNHEPETPWMLQAVCGAPVVLHVGASNGRHAFALLRKLPEARVHAIEPASFNVSVLKQGVAMRGLKRKVEIIQAAVSDTPGTMTLVTPRKTTGKRARAYAFLSQDHIDRPDFHGTGHFTERVKVVRLDDCGFDHVDFIRMDIEGAEHAALLGATTILDRDRPNALIEIHPTVLRERFHSSAEQVAQMFRSRGYRFFALGAEGIEERVNLATARDYQDFFFIHPSRPLPEGVFKTLLSRPALAA